jgi:hypothetical protein
VYLPCSKDLAAWLLVRDDSSQRLNRSRPAGEPGLPGPEWWCGLLFSIDAWFLMMITLLPLAGAGLFGAYLGPGAAVSALIIYMMWGVVLCALHQPMLRRWAAAA